MKSNKQEMRIESIRSEGEGQREWVRTNSNVEYGKLYPYSLPSPAQHAQRIDKVTAEEGQECKTIYLEDVGFYKLVTSAIPSVLSKER